ncbi:CRE-SRH-293 protein [Caenorhabditis remanei]|uniref:CRE-SRH-293 protein n=1 Tax=Caenorhabditis remanei TaxID=31234 RepID=E3LI25_CAERE|nr:CRE-SRH-293 protein [Caenorhabditis remanei]
MNLSCSPSVSYFDSPSFITWALHFVTVISTPIHFIGLYCILWKTPEEMKSAKWYLLNLHIWMIFFDYSVSFLTIPIVLMPAFAGIPLGILQAFNVSGVVQALIVLLFLGYVIASIIFIFENRFYTLCVFARYSFWSWLRHIWLATHYIGIAVLLTPFGFLIADQNEAKQKIFQSLPCLPNYIYDASVVAIADDDTYLYPLLMSILLVLLAIGEVALCILFLMWNTFQQLRSRAMSQKTFGMQKKFFLGLIVQVAVPLVMFCIPFLYAFISVMWKYYNQSFTNFSIICASLQGSMATFVMIFVHRPYRNAILSKFCKQKKTMGNVTILGAHIEKNTIFPVQT